MHDVEMTAGATSDLWCRNIVLYLCFTHLTGFHYCQLSSLQRILSTAVTGPEPRKDHQAFPKKDFTNGSIGELSLGHELITVAEGNTAVYSMCRDGHAGVARQSFETKASVRFASYWCVFLLLLLSRSEVRERLMSI